jgi:Protein of unknown function (DUF1232)/Sulfotransferase domain
LSANAESNRVDRDAGASLRTFEAAAGGESRSFGQASARARRSNLIGQRSHILVACMPKSGSTFLTDVIAALPGFRRAVLVPAYGRREQELDEFCLRQFDRFDFVAQNHVHFSDWTAEMCGDYGLAPIVLVRSLLDVIVSLRDHLRNDGPVSPIYFVEPHHAALDDAQLELMIARLALPWYINFYMSWRQAPDAMMIQYEDLTAHPREVIGKVLAFSGAVVTPAEVDAAIAQVRGAGASRFNVGRAGRGANLRPEVLRAVLELIEFYPEALADPYIQATRAQCLEALTGAAASVPAPTAPAVARRPRPFATARRWWRRNALRVVMRGLVPMLLTAAALLYWMWPNDLLPDARALGYVDDVGFLLFAGLIAGRLTAYKPHAPKLRR